MASIIKAAATCFLVSSVAAKNLEITEDPIGNKIANKFIDVL